MRWKKKQVSIRQAAEKYGLSYGFLHRRLSGEVELDSRNGPKPIFSVSEEEAMATWLKEMSERGMGLKPGEFLDFVERVVTEEKRDTPFKNGRPSYDWYKAFMTRNSHIIQIRQETSLEACRAKLSKDDKWFSGYRDFVIRLGLADKPRRIFNADESGFSLGSKTGKVIGPLKSQIPQVPHVSGGHSKQRLTVMFCASADGAMLPPYFVYPTPPPRGYNPLTGAIENSAITYTSKGWMDSVAFQKFIQHFDKHCGTERPVILLIDSVSSHVNMNAFEDAKSKGIELYRLVPNATHIMQPLDKGVFGPLKKRWHQVLRCHSRENPGSPVGKDKFAELLKEAFLLFYKPLTVINSFKSTGLYPVDSTVITSIMLKPGLTFSEGDSQECCESETVAPLGTVSVYENNSLGAFNALESALETPVRRKYKQRIEENYDIEGLSPCYQVYKKLYFRSNKKTTCPSTDSSKAVSSIVSPPPPDSSAVVSERSTECSTDCKITDSSGLDLLAAVVCSETENKLESTISVISVSNTGSQTSEKYETLKISPVLEKSLIYPHAGKSDKAKIKRLVQDIPDNLTSPDALRKMALKELQTVKLFARKEKAAKTKYIKLLEKKGPLSKKTSKKTAKGKSVMKNIDKSSDSENVNCMGCHMSWQEDQALQTGSVWIQCDKCDGWLHKDCCANSDDFSFAEDSPFTCPDCEYPCT